ncbi:MAG: methylated-DNA--[protein]-cysteine S-methyltransferase [Acidobacteriota bacterium]
MDLRQGVVTRVLIAPSRKEAKDFVSFSDLPDTEYFEELFGVLSEYFAGARFRLGLRWDFGPSELTGFARRVLRETSKIPFGRTRTYRDIAKGAGKPDAYRLVLATLIENPIPIVVPCHRVVTNKSGIGSYIGGKDRKKWLLEMEKEALKQREKANA